MTQERLQKVLARGGVASRRAAEQLIVAGRVTVNGKVAQELGVRVDPTTDRVEVDGKAVLAEPTVYYLFHKPRGVVTTLSDPEGRPALQEYVKHLGLRVFPIGRLDFHTSGALLLTNDGELSNALLHPKGKVPKVYLAKIRGVVTDVQLEKWREGVVLLDAEGRPDGGPTLPAEVDLVRYEQGEDAGTRDFGHSWLRVVLKEGRNRQIHRMAEATGLFVMRLSRLSFAGLTTDGLGPGEVRPLTAVEVAVLRRDWLGIVDEELLSLARGGQRKREVRGPREVRVAPPEKGGKGGERAEPKEQVVRAWDELQGGERRPAARAERAPQERPARGPRPAQAPGPQRKPEARGEGARGPAGPRVGQPTRDARGEGARSAGPSRGPREQSRPGPSRGPSGARSAGPDRGERKGPRR